MSELQIKIISAGAGSGKTYRLTQEMVKYITEKGVRTSGIVATTFTQKAASELQERVRVKLLEDGMFETANELPNAMIGTVHSIGVKLLQRFAFEAGVSPEVSIMAEEDAQLMFNNALSKVLTDQITSQLDDLSTKLGKNKVKDFDWRKDIKTVTDLARGNDFDAVVLEKSRVRSFETFATLLPPMSGQSHQEVLSTLSDALSNTIETLQQSGDETKVTQDCIKEMKNAIREIKQQQYLPWYQWAKLSKLSPSVKSRPLIEPLRTILATHEALSDFQNDIKGYIDSIFEISKAAIVEFQEYKKRRGLIDYTDMEVLVKQLLSLPEVQQVLREELDLLMVDEFQDTNPIQLDIFFKLSQLAKYSIWVGDPKQSIYGFRGADPRLMQAIVDAQGGVKPEDIQRHSYRSRQDIVNATNAIFAKAFNHIPEDQVALIPHRTEDDGLDGALMHWHFRFDGEGRQPAKEWFNLCLADKIKKTLAEGLQVIPKGGKKPMPIRPCDIAILCRTNTECQDIADALHYVGIKAAIARKGLLQTAEAQLLIACLKYALYPSDALSVAEILVLATELSTAEIIEDRLQYVSALGEQYDDNQWAIDNAYIAKINELREKAREFSASELLNLLIEELDLRRLIMTWGNVSQRLDNVDIIRKMALDYEDACNRLQSAASLGGFLLWLQEVAVAEKDIQAAGEQTDAVNVLTYHKSKGLEWPLAICHALETELRNDVWNIALIPEKEKVDLDNLLGNRWIRFWINPYAEQIARTPLMERIENSDAQREATLAATQEEARLMYVGITRARDYLVFPSRKNPTKWLNRVWHNQADMPTLDAEKQETEWEWKGHFLPIKSEVLLYEREIPSDNIPLETFYYLAQKQGRGVAQPYKINLENEQFSHLHRLSAKKSIQYSSPIAIDPLENPVPFAKALVLYHLSMMEHLSDADKTAVLSDIFVKTKGESSKLSLLTLRINSFHQWLENHCQISKQYKQYPIQYLENQRCFETQIHQLVFTNNDEIIVIQHDSFSGEKHQEKAQSYLDWAFWTSKALRSKFPQCTNVQCLIHFPMSGTVCMITN